jgi:hypothetical protein
MERSRDRDSGIDEKGEHAEDEGNECRRVILLDCGMGMLFVTIARSQVAALGDCEGEDVVDESKLRFIVLRYHHEKGQDSDEALNLMQFAVASLCSILGACALSSANATRIPTSLDIIISVSRRLKANKHDLSFWPSDRC